jgi:hypothetical protein
MTGNNATSVPADDDSVVRVLDRVYAVLANNNADPFVAGYAEDATAVLPGTYLPNKDAIRGHDGAGLRPSAQGLHCRPRGAEHPVRRCRG